MALMAMCMPILPGKKEIWMNMIEQVRNDPNFIASRDAAGVHERTFLQETPAGDFVVLTFEGENPAEGLAKSWPICQLTLLSLALEVHGLDVNGPPPAMPTLVFDSKA